MASPRIVLTPEKGTHSVHVPQFDGSQHDHEVDENGNIDCPDCVAVVHRTPSFTIPTREFNSEIASAEKRKSAKERVEELRQQLAKAQVEAAGEREEDEEDEKVLDHEIGEAELDADEAELEAEQPQTTKGRGK